MTSNSVVNLHDIKNSLRNVDGNDVENDGDVGSNIAGGVSGGVSGGIGRGVAASASRNFERNRGLLSWNHVLPPLLPPLWGGTGTSSSESVASSDNAGKSQHSSKYRDAEGERLFNIASARLSSHNSPHNPPSSSRAAAAGGGNYFDHDGNIVENMGNMSHLNREYGQD